MYNVCFSAKPLLLRFITFSLLAVFLAACDGNSIDKSYIPVADAGDDQNTRIGEMITLDASESSDADDEVLSYRWEFVDKPVNSNAVIVDADTVSPRFSADVNGTYVFQLIVNDGKTDSKPDQLVIIVGDVLNAPIASAGDDQTGVVGELIELVGSGSSSDKGELAFSWTIKLRPEGSKSTLSNSDSAEPSFSPDKVGKYILELRVKRGELESLPDEIIIQITGNGREGNTKPVAVAGQDQRVTIGSEVLLSGAASKDIDDDDLTYRWELIGKPQNSLVALNNVNNVEVRITPDIAGEYLFQLMVNDGMINSLPSIVKIIVKKVVVIVAPVNTPPIANAGEDQTAFEGEEVILNGSKSNDSDGNIVKYEWKEGSTVLSLLKIFTKKDFSEGSHKIILTVTDNKGAKASATIILIIKPVDATIDTTPPVITMNGSDLIIDIGSTFKDAGATALDNRDGVVDVITAGVVNTNVIGTYVITYTATDLSNNTATRKRIIKVVESTGLESCNKFFTEHTELSTTRYFNNMSDHFYHADLDGDGYKDIISLGNNSSYKGANLSPMEDYPDIFWMKNDGNGYFSNRLSIEKESLESLGFIGLQRKKIIITDIDNDGDNDLVIGNGYWYINDGNGQFSKVGYKYSSSIDLSYYSIGENIIYVGDLDGDNNKDLIILLKNPITGILDQVWLKNIEGIFHKKSFIIDRSNNNVGQILGIGDIDSDGDIDLITNKHWIKNDGSGNFTTHSLLSNILKPDEIIAIHGHGNDMNGSNYIKIIDIDNDGDKDLVFVTEQEFKKEDVHFYSGNHFRYRLNYLENNSNEQFTRHVLSTKISRTRAKPIFSISDINNDGHVDIVTSDLQTTLDYHGGSPKGVFRVQLFKNNAKGGFVETSLMSKNIKYSVYEDEGYLPKKLFLSDLDGDGDKDVLIHFSNSREPIWYENCDIQALDKQPPKIYINKDSSIHINNTEGDIYLQKDEKYIELGASANDLKDGQVEVTVSGSIDTSQVGVSQYITYTAVDSSGNISTKKRRVIIQSLRFNPHLVLDGSKMYNFGTIDSAALSAIVIDVDKDGKLDVVSANLDKGLQWHKNKGNGEFTTELISYGKVFDVSAGDLDNDGDVDLLADFSSGLYWFENDGSNSFSLHKIANTPPRDRSNIYDNIITIIDINKDGNLDIVASRGYGSNFIAWYENDGNASFIEHSIATISQGSRQEYNSHVVDFDNDGDLDIITNSEYHVSLFENNGSEEFTYKSLLDMSAYSTDIVIVDLDNDNKMDIVSITGGFYSSFVNELDSLRSSQGIVWHKNIGEGLFQKNIIPHGTVSNRSNRVWGGQAGFIKAKDVDGDNDIDLIVSRSEYGVGYIAWLENNGEEQFTEHPVMSISKDYSSYGNWNQNSFNTSVIVEDIDQDGDVDFLSIGHNIIYHEQTSDDFTLPVDTVPPIFYIKGDAREGVHNINSLYDPPLIEAFDDRDGRVPVLVSGSLDTSTLGVQRITYTATDSSGNSSSIVHEFNILDYEPPVIILKGERRMILDYGSIFHDPGASVKDNYDNEVILTSQVEYGGKVVTNVDTNIIFSFPNGEPPYYIIRYTASDAAGNIAQKLRTVVITQPTEDKIPPIITLNGGDEEIQQGDTYIDKGATATDNSDGTINVITTGMVDTTVPDTYIITYTATDSDDNKVTATRSVIVKPNKVSLTKILSPASGSQIKYNFITLEIDASVSDVQARNLTLGDTIGKLGIKNDNAFLIYNMVLKKGENEIEISANGGDEITTIIITSEGKGIPPVGLEIDQTKAFSSLVTDAIVRYAPLTVSEYMIDINGDEVIDIKSAFDTVELNFTTTGAFHTSVTVRTSDNILYTSFSAFNESINIIENPESQSAVITGINAKIYDLEEYSNYIYALTASTLFKISKDDPSNVEAINLPALNTPEGFAFDREGNVYIADTGSDRIVKLLASNAYQEDTNFILNEGGSDDGQLLSPKDVTLSGRGDNLNIYVLDAGNNRVQIFDNKGHYLAKFDGSTTPEGKLNNPLNMIGSSNLTITDYGNNLIREFSYNRRTQEETSKIITSLNNMGKASFTEQGVFIPDNGNKKLLSISSNGESLQSIPMSKANTVALFYEQDHQLLYQEEGSNQLKHIFIPKTTLENAPLALSKKFVQAYLGNDNKTILNFTSARLLRLLKTPEVNIKAQEAFSNMTSYKENIYMYGLKAVVQGKAQTSIGEVAITFNFNWQKGRWLLGEVR